MKNNKGFALSMTIYSLFIIMLLVVFYILYIITSNRTSVGAITKSVEAETNAETIFNPPKNDWEYGFVGDYQVFTVPRSGKYKFELWGASTTGLIEVETGKYPTSAYVKGELTFSNSNLPTLYVYVGESPSGNNGGWNGGGKGPLDEYGAGGASDIRTVPGPWDNINSLDSRIIVAGGVGSSASNPSPSSGSATIIVSGATRTGSGACTGLFDYENGMDSIYKGGTENCCVVIYNAKGIASSLFDDSDVSQENNVSGISGRYKNSETYIKFPIASSPFYYTYTGNIRFKKGRGDDSGLYANSKSSSGSGGGGYYGGLSGNYRSGTNQLSGGGGGSSYASGFCTSVADGIEGYTFANVIMRSYNTLGDSTTGIPNAYGEGYLQSHQGHGRVKIHYCGDENSTC